MIEPEVWELLTPQERKRVHELAKAPPPIWRPHPDNEPQRLAFEMADKVDVLGYGGAAGGGKGLALDTLIPTPDGWARMGSLAVGDQVLDDQGRPCSVTAVSDVQQRQCYRLTFDDGATLVADDVHRWVTYDAAELRALTRRTSEYRAQRRARRPSRGTGKRPDLARANSARAAVAMLEPPPSGSIRSTAEIAKSLVTSSGRRNHAIPVAGALALEAQNLPIPPYTLGAWLGDGASRNAQVTSADPEVIRRIERDGFQTRHYGGYQYNVLGLLPMLRAAGLLQDKHVPKAYLRASRAQRLALMQGLMDTDGSCTVTGKCEFTSSRRVLAEAVRELALSLGVKASVREGRARLRGRDCGPRWRVVFTTTLAVFGLERKRARQPTSTRRTTRFRYVVGCEPVESVPTRCIAVDSPTRQYLAGDSMVPTHNTDLGLGLALLKHRVCQIFRREGTELGEIIDRCEEIVGHSDGLVRSTTRQWRDPTPTCHMIQFGSVPHLENRTKYQGRAKDFLWFDEASNFLREQVEFLMGWVRDAEEDPAKKRHCLTLLTFNPPTNEEGRWIVDFFGPWVDKRNPHYGAKSGDILHMVQIGGNALVVERPDPFVIERGEWIYDFDPEEYTGRKQTKIIHPRRRTFIEARVTDNPYLMSDPAYIANLQSMPEELRDQMLEGDFEAAMADGAFQLIPTDWIDAAMDRWEDKAAKPPMDSMGVDVAMRGRDSTIISPRYGFWFDRQVEHPGSECQQDHQVASYVVAQLRDRAVIHLDLFGVGAEPYGVLKELQVQVVGVNVGDPSAAATQDGNIGFLNLKAELWWRMREALQPKNAEKTGIALPPCNKLRADLAAPKWKLVGGKIKVESKEELIKRIGRSPDRGDAAVLALMDTPKIEVIQDMFEAFGDEYDPYRNL